MRCYTTELPRIDISKALKAVPVTDENQGHIRLAIGPHYNSTVSLPIEVTKPFYGGYRVWFDCPISGCGRRTPHLYVDGDTIACRECLRLRAIIALLLYQGLRTVEICRLDVADVDTATGRLQVLGKGRDDKEYIFLHPQTAKALKTYHKASHVKDGSLFYSLWGKTKGERLTTRGCG